MAYTLKLEYSERCNQNTKGLFGFFIFTQSQQRCRLSYKGAMDG